MENRDSHKIPIHVRIEAAVRMSRRQQNLEKVTEISRDMNISRDQLYALEKKYLEDPSMQDREREGRPKKVDETMKRRILREVKKNPFESSLKIAQTVNEEIEEEKQISSSTVRTVALKDGYFARRPALKPPLKPAHISQRFEFAKLHRHRTTHFWSQVIFMDECMIKLNPKDLRKRVRRKKGERLDRRHIVPRVKYEGGGVMYWAAVSWSGTGPLIEIEDTLTGSKYAEILDDNIAIVKQNLNIRSPYFIEDQATVHRTNDVLEVKEEHNLKDLNLPPNSPDLNIIETVWSYWKTKVSRRDPCSLENLRRMLTRNGEIFLLSIFVHL